MVQRLDSSQPQVTIRGRRWESARPASADPREPSGSTFDAMASMRSRSTASPATTAAMAPQSSTGRTLWSQAMYASTATDAARPGQAPLPPLPPQAAQGAPPGAPPPPPLPPPQKPGTAPSSTEGGAGTATKPSTDRVFWELVFVWSLSRNEVHKDLLRKAGLVRAFQEGQAHAGAGRAGREAEVEGGGGDGGVERAHSRHESARSSAPAPGPAYSSDEDDEDDKGLGAMVSGWLTRKADDNEMDPEVEDMLRSPRWRRVRRWLLDAGLSVRLVSCRESDEFFMAVGATLPVLQEEAERAGYELRVRGLSAFFAYQATKDEYYERWVGPTAFSSCDRQRLIESRVQRTLVAKCQLGIVQLRNLNNSCTDFFVLHDGRERASVEAALGVAEGQPRILTPRDLADLSPEALEATRRYFGEHVCFYFAFLRFYTRALALPALAGVGVYAFYVPARDVYRTLCLGFGVLVTAWAAIFIEHWKRRQATLRHLWDMDEYNDKEGDRLGFRGRFERGLYTGEGHWVALDACEVLGVALEPPFSLRSSAVNRRAKECTSIAVLVAMGGLCVATTVLVFFIRAAIAHLAFGPYVAGGLNAVAISSLNYIFRNVALSLNEWENHRRSSTFNKALVIKLFIFQSINNYFPLFYLAFIKPFGFAPWEAQCRRPALALAPSGSESEAANPLINC